jgi:murein DD-endopeptidase MepM/ murein hydrolase activator NlpD/Ca2+-binding RTX toxin-like protein
MTQNSQNQIYFPVIGGANSSSKYGIRKHPITGIESEHKGIDYGAPEGTPVVAIKSGTITRIGWQSDDHSKGFGQRISIKYDDGSVYEGFYGHLSGFADGLKTKFDSGETVKVRAGQVIGYVGSTGGSTGNHLHYEEAKFVNGKKVETNDPTSELSKATILNKDGTKIPVESSGGTFTTVIDFFSSTATSISDFFKNFNSEVEGIVNLNPFVTAKVGNPNFLIGFNQESSYTVKSGDSISKIATDNNTTVDKILEANPNIENPNLINVGDSIVIPKIVEQHSFNLHNGDATIQLASFNGVARDFSFVDSNGNPTSEYSPLFKIEDDNGNIFTLIGNNIYIPLKDGTIAAANVVLETLDSAQTHLSNFMDSYLKESTALFTTPEGVAGMISDISAGIQRGDSAEEIAKIIAVKTAVRTLANQVSNQIIFSQADQAAIESGNLSDLSTEGAESLQMMQSNPYYKTAYTAAIAFVTTILLNANEGWDSEQYTQAAVQSVAQASAQIAVSAYFSSTSAASGVGAGVAHLVSAAINDIFADDHMNSHQWQSTVNTAGVLGAAAYTGSVVGAAAASAIATAAGASLATAAAIGSFAGPIGAVIAIIIVTQFMGGKEYGAGEYPNPYSYLQITPKADGTGNVIIGIESEGVVAIAREYYHDDLYGNSGSDNLIGKSGTNTIYGYGGNDHLEGRGDIDLIVGGEGDDEIFGGNSDDQLYGSQGSDNIFGGAGNDIIIGDTGSSLTTLDLTLMTNNDFIQGGTGDDQIMGELGDDTIYGNAGNDTILGGTGNDKIEGGDGDDSILGEDGDDLIIAGEGSDIIDGGAGVDIIHGNAGNDNIRGGDDADEIYGQDGVDIIYGDAGNDLISSGSDNDLVFGGIGNDIIYGAAGENSLYGEIGNDYVIGGDEADTIDGGADDDVILGNQGNDAITTGIGNDTIIFKSGDGQDTIDETDTITNYSIDEVGEDVIRLSDFTSKLTDETTNRLVLTKSGSDLIINFLDDSGALISDQITVKNQLSGDGEIIKRIEFADGYQIDLTTLTVPTTDGTIPLTTSDLQLTTEIATTIQEELVLGYNDQMQYLEDQANPDSSYLADNYQSSGEQDEIDSERYNEMEWRSRKEKRNIFGGHYTVWYKYYEQNLGGTSGNDRIVGHWWSENIYGGEALSEAFANAANDNFLPCKHRTNFKFMRTSHA